MIDALKFVRGTVAKKDLVPALKHFRIENGTVRGFNGVVALSSPIALDITCSPNAVQLIKSIQACDETVQLHLSESSRLVVKSGKFKAHVECSPEAFPDIAPEGTNIDLGSDFLDVVQSLAPFVSDDASRPWAHGAMFRGGSAFATNNLIIVEKWIGKAFPEINIPKETLEELIRIGDNPIRMQATDSSVSFHFSDGRWLRSQVLSTAWPDVSTILNTICESKEPPAGFFEAIEKIAPFVENGRVFFSDGAVSTSNQDGVGASVEVRGVPAVGCYVLSALRSLHGVADTFDFSQYPSPCMFFGRGLRGALIGLQV